MYERRNGNRFYEKKKHITNTEKNVDTGLKKRFVKIFVRSMYYFMKISKKGESNDVKE